MKRHVFLWILVTATVFIPMFTGCGGSSPPTAHESSLVSVAIVTSPSHLGASETYQFTATVANTANTSVAWSVSGCASACGTISGTGFYTAPGFVPSATTVVIIATSQADSTKSASVSLPLKPVSVSVAPDLPLNVKPGSTRSFTATLDHDPKNAGVTWALSGSGCSGDSCGKLENVTVTTVMYCAPAAEPSPNAITLTAKSVTDPAQKAWVTMTVSATPFVLRGNYAFLINGWGPAGREAMAGQFTVDGKGNLVGIWDANRGATANTGQAITGSYSIQPDGHGTLTMNVGSESFSFVVSLDASGEAGRLAEATIPSTGSQRGTSGYLLRQDPSYFTLSSVAGDRVIALYGEATGSHVAALGQFAGTQAGAPGKGRIDLSWQINQNVARFANTVDLAANFAEPDATTGRGTVSLLVTGGGAGAAYHFYYYIVTQDRLLLVQTDARGFNGGLLIPMLSGEVRLQKNGGAYTNASLNTPVIFHITDSTDDWAGLGYPLIRVGQMTPSGSGTLDMIFDQNVGGRDPEMIGFQNGGKITLNGTTTGTYSVAANGRATWELPPGMVFPTIDETSVAYLVDQNTGFLMTPDIDGAGFGVFEPQQATAFSISALAGTYLLNTGPAAEPTVENDGGWLELDENGNGTALLYVNSGSGASALNLTANATVGSNGRGTLVLSTTSPAAMARNLVFWAISLDRWVAISTINSEDTKPAILFIER